MLAKRFRTSGPGIRFEGSDLISASQGEGWEIRSAKIRSTKSEAGSPKSENIDSGFWRDGRNGKDDC